MATRFPRGRERSRRRVLGLELLEDRRLLSGVASFLEPQPLLLSPSEDAPERQAWSSAPESNITAPVDSTPPPEDNSSTKNDSTDNTDPRLAPTSSMTAVELEPTAPAPSPTRKAIDVRSDSEPTDPSPAPVTPQATPRDEKPLEEPTNTTPAPPTDPGSNLAEPPTADRAGDPIAVPEGTSREATSSSAENANHADSGVAAVMPSELSRADDTQRDDSLRAAQHSSEEAPLASTRSVSPAAIDRDDDGALVGEEAGAPTATEPDLGSPLLAPGMTPLAGAGLPIDVALLQEALAQFLDGLDNLGAALVEGDLPVPLWMLAAGLAGAACEGARRQMKPLANRSDESHLLAVEP